MNIKKILIGSVVSLVIVAGSTQVSAIGIHEAAKKGDLDGVEHELKKGVSVNADNWLGCTPLLFSINKEDTSTMMVEKLIGLKADVNRFDLPFRTTPLMAAAYFGNIDVIEKLLKAGANISLVNQDQKTAEQIAREFGHKEAAEAIAKSTKK